MFRERSHAIEWNPDDRRRPGSTGPPGGPCPPLSLYSFVVAQPEPVDRDAAAAGAGIGRPLAAFHLDRLAAAGLLEVEYHRRSGRTGPGAGRPAKFYRRARGLETSVSLPPRHYDDLAEILAEGIEQSAAPGPKPSTPPAGAAMSSPPPPPRPAIARGSSRRWRSAATSRRSTRRGHPPPELPLRPAGDRPSRADLLAEPGDADRRRRGLRRLRHDAPGRTRSTASAASHWRPES